MRNVAKTSRNFIGQTIAVIGAAVSVSAAVRSKSKPAASDLEMLGIDAEKFHKVNL